jgi:hypothetical protein
MTLRAIVRALGGDLYDGGRRANVPAPNHSAADRSVSLLLQGDRVVVHSFGGGDWREVLDDLRERRLVDDGGVLLDRGHSRHAAPVAPSQRERRAAALRIWEDGRPITGTLSERHCQGRGITRALPGLWALRHNQETAVSVYRPGRQSRPALLAGIQDAADDYTAVEVAYLASNGRRACDLKLARKTVGVAPGGCAVRLDPPADAMLVAEGVFTTLSASERFGLPGWALLSTRNLRAWRAPPGVRSVLIAGDRGRDGETSAARLKERLEADGVTAAVELPPRRFGDWNEWAQR